VQKLQKEVDRLEGELYVCPSLYCIKYRRLVIIGIDNISVIVIHYVSGSAISKRVLDDVDFSFRRYTRRTLSVQSRESNDFVHIALWGLQAG